MDCTGTTRSSKAGVIQLGLLAALVTIGAICYLAATHESFPGDEEALLRFQEFRGDGLDTVAIVVTATAQTWVAIVSILGLSFIFRMVGRRADALVTFSILVFEALNLGLKELVGRPRPPYSILESPPVNPSFPSGHAFHAILLFGFLLIVLVGEEVKNPRLRRTLQGLLVFMILACGASRVYLGVHWPSDVLAGYLLGGFVLLFLVWLRKMLITRGLQ